MRKYKYLTIAEIASLADIPNSTCRRYLTAFESFFMVKGGSRLKKYDMSAVDVLKRIKQLYDEGQDTNEIYNVLANDFPLVTNVEEQQENQQEQVMPSTSLSVVTSDELEGIQKALEEQRVFNLALIEELKEQRQLIEKKDRYIEQSLERRDKELVESLRSSMNNKELQKQLNEIQTTLSEIAVTKKKNKGFFRWLFGE